MHQTQSRIRPVMTSDAFEAAIQGMSNEQAQEALKPGTDLGSEFRRMIVSLFVRTRLTARSNAEQRKKNAGQVRTVRRKIAELERSQWAFLNSANLLQCRRYLRDIQETGRELREKAAEIGKSVENSAMFMTVTLRRDFVLDLLNVGSFAKEWANDREHPIAIEEIVRAGFADEPARGKSNRDIEPMQYCLLHANRSPYEQPKVEATPEQFEALDTKVSAYRTLVEDLLAELSAVAKAERALKRPMMKQVTPVFKRRASVLEAIFSLWAEHLQPLLIGGGKGFSLAQKLAILRADPLKVQGKDLPEEASLLELVGGGHVETCEDDEAGGPFMLIGVTSNTTEWRDQLELCHAMLARDGNRILAASGKVYGIEGMPAHPTLQ
ncbi:hypothetical protein M0D68_06810 [Paraburkholderia sp. SEWSISQ10-3 4]|nr:hypothetical protein [Paraburkholderia aspalathi]MDN7170578.1 hypothetical protein [Paraburkholderia sp. SEWSISQ10-3 4]MDQ6500217.1 hypothetical protein [Paraburkholderia aspalathi]